MMIALASIQPASGRFQNVGQFVIQRLDLGTQLAFSHGGEITGPVFGLDKLGVDIALLVYPGAGILRPLMNALLRPVIGISR